MRFSSLLYLKVFKNIKRTGSKKSVDKSNFEKNIFEEIQTLCRPNRAAFIPPESPKGGQLIQSNKLITFQVNIF